MTTQRHQIRCKAFVDCQAVTGYCPQESNETVKSCLPAKSSSAPMRVRAQALEMARFSKFGARLPGREKRSRKSSVFVAKSL